MLSSLIFAASVVVTWQAPQTNVPITGYRLYQAATPGAYTSTFIDVGNVTTKQLTLSLPQCFRVTAYNGFGESVPSAEMCAAFPPPPSGVAVSPAP